MIELISGMPEPLLGRIFLSAKIKAFSRFKRFLCFNMIDVRCLRIIPWVHKLHVEHHWSGGYLFKSGLFQRFCDPTFRVMSYLICLSVMFQISDFRLVTLQDFELAFWLPRNLIALISPDTSRRPFVTSL
jgi:hypothetical protein